MLYDSCLYRIMLGDLGHVLRGRAAAGGLRRGVFSYCKNLYKYSYNSTIYHFISKLHFLKRRLISSSSPAGACGAGPCEEAYNTNNIINNKTNNNKKKKKQHNTNCIIIIIIIIITAILMIVVMIVGACEEAAAEGARCGKAPQIYK